MKGKLKLRLILTWRGILFVALLFAGNQSPAQPLTIINVGHAQISPNALAVWVARDRGLFRKYGLDPRIVFLAGETRISQALIAGELQVGIGGGGGTIRSAGRGGDLVFIAGLINRLNFKLWTKVNSSITRVEQLKGKSVGVGGLGDLPHMVGKLILMEHGMKPTDVTFIALGSGAARLAGLEKGVVDAAIFGPFGAGVAERLKLIFDAANLKVPYPSTSVISTRRFIQNSPDVVEKAIKALAESASFIHNSANKGFVEETLRMRLNLKSSGEAESYYKETVLTLDQTLSLPVQGVEAFIRFLAEEDSLVGKVKVEDVVDLRFVQNLVKTGFFDHLAGKAKP